MKRMIIALIKLYQKMPGYYHASCHFYPTCSNYMIDALNEYGTVNLSADDFAKIDSEHILHYEKNPYGIRAIVKRAAGKYDFERVDIEELFVAMIKELNR